MALKYIKGGSNTFTLCRNNSRVFLRVAASPEARVQVRESQSLKSNHSPSILQKYETEDLKLLCELGTLLFWSVWKKKISERI